MGGGLGGGQADSLGSGGIPRLPHWGNSAVSNFYCKHAIKKVHNFKS